MSDFKLEARAFRRVTDAEVYSCRFNNRAGWAVLILHDETGTVAVHSDYGDWVYSWPRPGRGECSLREFLASCSEEYVAQKFMGRDERRIFDFDGTVKAFKEAIIQSRRERNLDQEKARSLFNDVVDMEEIESEDLFWERLSGDLHDFIDGDYYGYAAHKPEAGYLWLRDGILPALLAEIRKTKPEAAPAGGLRWPHDAEGREVVP